MIHPDKTIFHGSAKAFLDSDKRFFACPIDQTRNILSLPFARGHSHPFTEGMSDVIKDASMTAHPSKMALFYQQYQPKNLLEAFFKDANHPLLAGLPLEDLDVLIHLSTENYLVPWVDTTIPMGGWGQNMAPAEGSHYLGPVSEKHLLSEFQRLKDILISVQTSGFNVHLQTDTIRGYFLFHQSETTCVIVGGNHRVGVLAALNAPYIPIELHPKRPKEVTLDQLDQWPMVKNGMFSPGLATAIFRRFFSHA